MDATQKKIFKNINREIPNCELAHLYWFCLRRNSLYREAFWDFERMAIPIIKLYDLEDFFKLTSRKSHKTHPLIVLPKDGLEMPDVTEVEKEFDLGLDWDGKEDIRRLKSEWKTFLDVWGIIPVNPDRIWKEPRISMIPNRKFFREFPTRKKPQTKNLVKARNELLVFRLRELSENWGGRLFCPEPELSPKENYQALLENIEGWPKVSMKDFNHAFNIIPKNEEKSRADIYTRLSKYLSIAMKTVLFPREVLLPGNLLNLNPT